MHLLIPDASAQLFSNSGEALPNTLYSAVSWADLDGDGDLEMSISGEAYELGTEQGKLYFFDALHKIVSNKNIRPISTGDQSWSDFNNDGSPDLLYAGTGAGNAASAGIDTFDVSLIYHSKFSGFMPVTVAIVEWGDYDNDGDYDVFISGSDVSGSIIAKLYKNTKGIFTDANAGLPGVVDGKAQFIDFDLDQDLDIFITGQDVNGNKYARLWKNTDGTFTVTSDVFVNLKWSQCDWGDLNSDGYPDLIIGGYDDSIERNLVYINNSGNGFTLSGIQSRKVQRGTTCFGDADNDGDLDVLMSGYKPIGKSNKFIFYNNGTNFMSYDSFISDSVYYSSAQFGDYDNDNDLDFVMNGLKWDGDGKTILVKNSCSTVNSKPSVPANLSAVVEGTSVIFTWNNSTDDKTPQQSITYNIYVGTASNKAKIVSPNAVISSGFRRIARAGYIRDNRWVIKNLPVGTYYWGVQAIDNSLAASAFSGESNFEIKDRFTKVSSAVTPTQTTPAVYFDSDNDNDLDLFLNHNNTALCAIENTLTPISQANYRTISSGGYYPVQTLSPNDYDNNNLIDFSISGDYDYNTHLMRDSTITLYHNNGSFSFNVVNDALVKNVNFEYVLWVDFNNDGKQDLITSGRTTNLGTGNKPVTYLYKNTGSGSFQNVPVNMRGFESTGAVAGDFDNDMDIDLLIYGKDLTGSANTYIYTNEGDFNFTETLIPNNELFREYLNYGIQTGDFNLDGQLDIFMAGTSPLVDRYARVLLNNSMNFTDANLQIRSSVLMSNFWADYDYDGDLDIFSTSSYTLPDNKVRLYLNNNGTLTEIVTDLSASHSLNLPFMAVNLDNKNGLDFIMKTEGGAYNQFYDNWGSNERITSAPANTNYDQDKLDIILKWDKISDCPGCTYNIRAGTTPGGVDIMSPMSDLNTGYRYVVAPGNAYLNNSWKLCDLPVGTYYWSAQAVDPSNTGGPWSAESTFTVSHIDADFSFTTVCLGDSTAFTDLTVATDPVTKWKWNFGDSKTSTLKNPKHLYAAAGTFSTGLWAYTSAGDSAYVNYNVQVKAVPVADFSANIACQGTSTALTNITNTNGLTILNWLWNFGDGETSNLQNPGTHGYLNPQNYQANLIVTADNGCADLVSKTVTVASYPIAVVTTDAPLAFCKGDSVTLSTTYNSIYTYKWMIGGTGLTGADSSKYVAKLSGNYTVEVVNPTGNCRDTSSVATVTVQDAPTPPLITASSTTVFCEGDSVVLSVTNTAGYTYQWKRDGGAVGTNSNQYTAKASGTYSLTVSNSTGCKAAATNTVTVTVNTKPVLPTVNISGSTTFCQGSSVTLSVSDNPSITYQWENNGIAITGEKSYKYTAQTSGVYSLRISDSNGCYNKSENVTVNVLTTPAAPLISTSKTPEFCQGDSVELSVTSNAGYNYQWKLNGGAVGTDSYRYSAKTSGAYTLSVSDSAGCSVNATNSIGVTVYNKPAIPTVSISGSTTFCQGSNVELSITNNPVFTYQWENNSAAITGATANIFTAQASGNYTLKITNSDGCSNKTENVTVSVLTVPAAPFISASKALEFCQGDSVELSVTGTAGYTYQWQINGVATGANSSKFNAKNTGTYNLTVLNSNKCSAVSANSLSVTVNAAPSAGNISLDGKETFCEGGSVTLSVPATAGYSYQWRNEYGIISGGASNSYTAVTTGNYQLEISDSYGCTARTTPVSIKVKPLPGILPDLVSTNYKEGVCPGDNPIRLSVSNTEPGFSYLWIKDGEPQVSDTLSNIEFYEQGIYKLRVELDECASETKPFPVNLPASPDKPLVYVRGPSIWYLVCSNTTAYDYKWYCNGKLIEGAKDYFYVAGSKVGMYQVSISNTQGCFTRSDVYAIPTGYTRTTGTDDAELLKDIKIYPNPTSGLLTIEMENNTFGSLIISIVNEQGKEIRNIRTEKTSEHFLTEIDLSSQPEGIYLINLKIEDYIVTRKVILE